jgi:hypothetical protein
MDKSHDSMERKMCPVCGKEFDSGAILLDTRMQYVQNKGYQLRQSMDRYTTTGYDLCPEHKKLWDAGYIALVVCDESKSSPSGKSMKMQDAFRTGEVIHIRKSAAEQVFVGVDLSHPMMFIDQSAAMKLKELNNESHG